MAGYMCMRMGGGAGYTCMHAGGGGGEEKHIRSCGVHLGVEHLKKLGAGCMRVCVGGRRAGLGPPERAGLGPAEEVPIGILLLPGT